MFGKKHIPVSVPYVKSVTVNQTVTEQRAPTDQSVALLKEMEAAAIKKADETLRLRSSDFECVVHIQFEDYSGLIAARAVFKINGKQLEAKADVDGLRVEPRGFHEELLLKLHAEIADVIAREIVAPAFDKAAFQLSRMR